ncbi:hypothetical protein EJ04DRAFT_510394 [Polyplosphaeria fusca]|uniref:Pentatricopeptide repeat-containing protein n=1 Tax=Polyplosphaeria fusca TaxID=682080 RepID=A0A9P4R285_9PLEO|nr:hypothetical protein EJ04DRAFT_510394 [Polyplosphaeria fusca]
MPRVHIRHARCLADATSPLLPFLAPRAFADSFVTRPTSRWNTAQTAKEKETRLQVDTHCVSRCNTAFQNATNSRKPHISKAPTPRSCLNNGPELVHRTPAMTRNHSRYSEIYAFAQSQVRSYTTSARLNVQGRRNQTATPKRTAPKMATSAGRWVYGTNYAPMRRLPRKRGRPEPVLGTAAQLTLADFRRLKFQKVSQQRLDSFVSRRWLEPSNRENHGRWRSLRRRLFNASLQKPKLFDVASLNEQVSRPRMMFLCFAALDRLTYPGVKRQTHFARLGHAVQVKALAERLCDGVPLESSEKLRDAWQGVDEEIRLNNWHMVLLYLLDRRPRRALQFLQVLAIDPIILFRNAYVLADALEHIGRRLRTFRKHQNSLFDADFVPVFWQVLGRSLPARQFLCSQDLLASLPKLGLIEDVKIVFDRLMESKVHIEWHTHLHFANRFAAAGEYEYALQVLRRVVDMQKPRKEGFIPKTERFSSHYQFRWTCALVLRRSMRAAESYGSTSKIVAEFFKLGVEMDTLLYNVVMHNAMEAGDFATAFKVFNVLGQEGLVPDKHTYSIMLNGCSMAEHPEQYSHFADHCFQRAKDTQDPWLAADCVFYQYRLYSKFSYPATLARKILEVYAEFFPINSLTSFPGNFEGIPNPGQMDPPPMALYIVFQTFIQKSLDIHHQRPLALYEQFVRIVQSQAHPAINQLARKPIIWNAFLLAFCKKHQFASASDLIKNMEAHYPIDAPKPNIYTWNILMLAFFKTDQPQAAERVFEIMKSRETEPDQFSFITLARGYAKAQYTEKLVDIMPSLGTKAQNHPGLLRGLARIHHRERLVRQLDLRRALKDNQDRERIETEQKKQRQRWEGTTSQPVVASTSESLQTTLIVAEEERQPMTSKQSRKQLRKERKHAQRNEQVLDLVDGSVRSISVYTRPPPTTTIERTPTPEPKPASRPAETTLINSEQPNPNSEHQTLQQAAPQAELSHEPQASQPDTPTSQKPTNQPAKRGSIERRLQKILAIPESERTRGQKQFLRSQRTKNKVKKGAGEKFGTKWIW